MRKTTNYNLSLYDSTDKMAITASENSLNANMELIDGALKEKADVDALGALASKDTVDKSDLASDIQASLNKADSALQSYTETDPTVPAWAKASTKPTYTASEVGADASGTASSAVSVHNTNTSAHADIREELGQLSSEKADKTYVHKLLEMVGTVRGAGTTITEQYIPTTLTEGYTAASGTVVGGNNGGLGYTEKISVTAGQKIKISFILSSDNYRRNYAPLKYIAAYVNGSSKATKDLGINAPTPDVYEYVVPDGVTEIVVSSRFYATGYTEGVIEITTIMEEEQMSFALDRNPIGYFHTEGDMVDGTILQLPINNVKNKTITTFFGNIGTLNKLYIGSKTDSSEKPYICIDSTTVSWKTDTNTEGSKTHGLTISDILAVRIETEMKTSVSKIVISTNGQSVDIVGDLGANIRWVADMGATFARSEGSTLNNCSLSFISKNIAKPIWAFGDSWFGYSSQRWVNYLSQDGFDKNIMLNAYAGENSQTALTSFKNLITVSKPDYVFWCMGMNDGDSSTEIDADWLSAYEELANICDLYNINLVLATIPSTPDINNSFKNDFIRNSGRRYVDFEKAVMADPSTKEWYTGMRYDNAHPDSSGAKALYHKVLADFPEIMIDGGIYESSGGGSVDTDTIVQEVINSLPIYGGETV